MGNSIHMNYKNSGSHHSPRGGELSKALQEINTFFPSTVTLMYRPPKYMDCDLSSDHSPITSIVRVSPYNLLPSHIVIPE